MKKTTTILNIPFSTMTFNQTVDWITSRINDQSNPSKTFIITANPEIVMMARSNTTAGDQMRQAVKHADLIIPDGIGVVLASRVLKSSNPNHQQRTIPERVAGYDLLHAIMQQANQQQWKVYLLGASPESNQGALDKLKHLYPNAEIVGYRDGYYKPDEEQQIIDEINRKQPHILFVALGAPRQEAFISQNLDRLNIKLAMGVGGSFDVLSGKMKRAPQIWQKLNLEWLHRLLSDPKRWRRQLALPRFALLVLKERFFPKHRN